MVEGSTYAVLKALYLVLTYLGLFSPTALPSPLSDMIESGIHAVLAKVAALGLDPHKHLGRTLQQV